MMRVKYKFGLRERFMAAMLAIVTISTGGFYYAVAQFIEFHEGEMLNRTLADELHEFADAYSRDPGMTGPHNDGFSSMVVPPGEVERLHPRLRDLAEGVHDDIILNGQEFGVGRKDVGDIRLYVLMDMEPVERLEARFVALAWACAFLSWIAAILMALWMSRLVMRPVSQLAQRVGNLDPARRDTRLADEFGDRETGLIATAFDRFLARMDEFVGREQAFTEDASHELRTPLATIRSAAELLEYETDLSPINHERVQRILRGVQQMQSLIEALLYLAREEGGVPSEEVALDQLVADAVDSQRETLRDRSLSMDVSTVPTTLRAPHGMVACVVNNLLLNAIHYTERGRIDLRVEPGRLSVQDTGMGIAPADLSRIFERRYRGSRSRGLGLGLYLVKRICDRLGWQVQVSSAPGTGTRFDVLFPVAR